MKSEGARMGYAEIAEVVGAPTTPFTPEKGALSTLFRWFADDDRLCVIAADPTMKPAVCDVGFSHALGHLGDRNLIVVFPAEGAEAVVKRLPFPLGRSAPERAIWRWGKSPGSEKSNRAWCCS